MQLLLLKRLVLVLVLFGTVCAAAVVTYVLHGWRLDDAIYMVVITVFGVGYGEVQPIDSVPLRAVTMALIFTSYGSLIVIVGGFVQMVMEGEISRALSHRRITRGIDELKGHTILCGFGRAGRILAKQLAEANHQFVVVDMDGDRLSEAESHGYLILQGNAVEEETLIKAGVERAKTLASVLAADADNVFITLTARELNPDLHIVARAEYASTEKKLIRSGANRVVLPAVIGGMRMAQLITRPSTEELLASHQNIEELQHELGHIGLKLDELPVTAGSPLDGHAVADIELGGNQGFLIVGVRKRDGHVLVDPEPTTKLADGDAVIVLGHHNDLPQLAKRYTTKKEIYYRGAKVEVTG
ncbi:potassium channel family protein [Aeoliella mucimassa]|uniref:potassium channel family protein n=1 Tax=Aeoliella mucimassa TaxID=2527972 RepID=UPI00119E5A62|nr:potassium channel protein [Aeoliella mucimassa]